MRYDGSIGCFTVDTQGRLVLPDSERNKLRLNPGDKLYFETGENGTYLHRPVSQLAKIYVEPTNRCNLACSTCIRHAWAEPSMHMEYAIFEKVLSAVDRLSDPPTIFFGGFGEPLFHPDIVSMVTDAKQKKCRVELITNGVLLEENMAHGLLQAGLDFLWISLDGSSPETYADVRLGNELPRILENLKRLRRIKYHYPTQSPHLGIAFVLMKRNASDLHNVVRLAFQLGAEEIMVTNVLPYSEEMKNEILYTRSMSMYQPRARSINLPRLDLTTINVENIREVFSLFELSEINGNRFPSPYNTCPFVERGSTSVRFDGKVSPCLSLLHDHTSYLDQTKRDIKSHFLGDLATEELLTVWRSSGYMKLRERLFEFDFSPCTVCNSCEYVESNDEDCFGSESPACGGCLWAQGFIQCP
jgi:MoaA/NifB/PqqE/SkfB family radical SAM enzyme